MTVQVYCNSSARAELGPKIITNVTVTKAGGIFYYLLRFETTSNGCDPLITTFAPPRTEAPEPTVPVDCGAYDSCSTCTQAPSGQCGFCAETKKCERGSLSGPSQGSCRADDWHWLLNSCRL